MTTTKAKVPTARPVTITPDLAREWLTRNTHNRPLNEKRLHQYVGAMKRGEWHENGDTFKFDRDGVLIDGQTRLTAILQAGVTIPGLVVEGLNPEAQLTVDRGQPRTFGQQLKLLGYANANSLSTLVRQVYFYETGQLRGHEFPPTERQLLNLVELNKKEFEFLVRDAQRIGQRLHLPRSPIGLALWAFRKIDAEDAEAFFKEWVEGVGFKEGDPVRALDMWARHAYSGGTVHRPLPLTFYAVIVKAWNAWRDGRHITNLSFKLGGPKRNAEQIPVPI